MKTYKKFVYQVILIASSMTITMCLIIYTFYKRPQSVLHNQKIFEKKVRYAKSITSKKLVLSAGSNVLFGLNAMSIENVLDIPTVNFGLWAALKTDYIIDQTKKILNPSDIVIMPLEYENFTWDGQLSMARSIYFLTYDKEYFNTLPIMDQIKMLMSITLSDLYLSYHEQKDFSGKEPNIGKGYTSASINKNGDETFKAGHKAQSIDHRKAFPLPAKPYLENRALYEIKKFNQWCTKRNIEFYISYPNTIDLPEYHTKIYQKYFTFLDNYFQSHGIKTIGKPTDFLYDKKYFYDTEYHLNQSGAVLRTTHLIELLKQHVDKIN
jgi:hypothetical protein